MAENNLVKIQDLKVEIESSKIEVPEINRFGDVLGIHFIGWEVTVKLKHRDQVLSTSSTKLKK